MKHFLVNLVADINKRPILFGLTVICIVTFCMLQNDRRLKSEIDSLRTQLVNDNVAFMREVNNTIPQVNTILARHSKTSSARDEDLLKKIIVLDTRLRNLENSQRHVYVKFDTKDDKPIRIPVENNTLVLEDILVRYER